jgi:ABC-type multidrug transport system permease subunit
MDEPWNQPEPEERQFSLSGLFFLVTVVALALAPIGWLPSAAYAAALGLAVLVFLAVITWIQTRRAVVLLLWWSLLVLYLTAAVAAFLER